jgi:hypothetical protein
MPSKLQKIREMQLAYNLQPLPKPTKKSNQKQNVSKSKQQKPTRS